MTLSSSAPTTTQKSAGHPPHDQPLHHDRTLQEAAAATFSPADASGDTSGNVTTRRLHVRNLHQNNNVRETTAPPLLSVLCSTLGLGSDAQSNATRAAVRAVQDALGRGWMHSNSSRRMHWHVRLGVPAATLGGSLPLAVDLAALAQAVVPPSVHLEPIEVVVGGLPGPSHSESHTTTGRSSSSSDSNKLEVPNAAAQGCITVVASVTWKAVAEAARPPPPPPQQTVPLVASPTSVTNSPPNHGFSNRPHPMILDSASPPAPPLQPEPVAQKQQTMRKPGYVRTSSMDVLALVSAEMHEQQPKQQQSQGSDESINQEEDGTMMVDGKLVNNYKKLPPGITPKNNKRLFVKHSYRDMSTELPTGDELELVGPNASLHTPNAAFPLKLHETISQIERDGFDHIVGWMPHGRSFKIHKHKEFVEIILPKYFVMTKKSSFLRQLNLYGFNRLSGVSADQGSYYHERFLRGLKFLSLRMQRQKVNGNGIRAAGNPDQEPVLGVFPSCPPTGQAQQAQQTPRRPPAKQQQQQQQQHVPPVEFVSAVQHPSFPPPPPQQQQQPQPSDSSFVRSTAQVSFPLKLQRILDKLEAEGKTDTISWLGHGRAFLVHDPQTFVQELMPKYFNQTKYSSFQRQLHMYNFSRITTGRDKGAYHHYQFLRGRPDLSVNLQRTRVNGKGTRRPGNPDQEPDLYKLPPLPFIAPGTVIDVPRAATADDATVSGDDDDGLSVDRQC